MKRWWKNYGLVVGVVALMVLCFGMIIAEHIHWNGYAKDHNCQEFSRQPDTRVIEYDKDGKRTERTERGKIGYRCDNGKTHWR